MTYADGFMAGAAYMARLIHQRRRGRVLLWQARHRAAGKRVAGSVPFGFRLLKGGYLKPEPKQQAAIAYMKRLHTRHVSYRRIVAKVKCRFGLRISPYGAQRIVDGRRVCDRYVAGTP